jgi:hypothetical protein
MKIQRIGEDIKNVLRKERIGSVKESKIGQAIVAGEKELKSELVTAFRTGGYIPEQLRPFIKSTALTFTDGKSTNLPDNVEDLVWVSVKDPTNSKNQATTIIKEPGKFKVGTEDDVMVGEDGNKVPNHLCKKEILINAAETNVPDFFIKALGAYNVINGENFSAIEVTEDKWGSRDLSMLIGNDPENPGQIGDINKVEETISAASLASGKAAVPANFIQLLSGSVTINGKEYEAVVLTPEEFNSRRFKELAANGEIKQNLAIIKSTITLTDGVGNLPTSFVRDKGVFQAGDFEGIILDNEEYLDRANSVILTPDEEEPIARIFDDQIEVTPSTIESIDLYHYAFPTEKQPAITVIDNEIHIDPIPATDLTVRYVKHPVQKRPIFKIADGKIHVAPTPTNFKLIYLAYPTELNAMVRFLNEEVDVLPETITDADCEYLAATTPAVYAVKAKANGRGYEFDEDNSTDTEFGENATQMILGKALKYLGVPYKDAGAVEFEKLQ